MRGVTQATYDGYRRTKGLTPRSVKYLTPAECEDCYRVLYWDKVCGDQLPKGIDFCVFDAAVNSGTPRAEKWLQQAINRVAGKRRLIEDGAIGFATIDASDDYPAEKVIEAMIDLRLGFMRIAKNTKTGALLWPIFGGGWSNRLLGYMPAGSKVRQDNGVLQVAKAMAAKNPAPVVAKVPLPPEALVRPTASVFSSTRFQSSAKLVAAGAIALAILLGVPSWPQP